MSKRKTYQKKAFESSLCSDDTSANLYHSMAISPAWNDLSPKQKVLYMACKDQLYHAHQRHPNNDETQFQMNREKWANEYRLYTLNDAKSFYRDMAALIGHGFIICLERGKTTRTANIYQYSDMWQKYGTPNFKIDATVMTEHMMNKLCLQDEDEDGKADK